MWLCLHSREKKKNAANRFLLEKVVFLREKRNAAISLKNPNVVFALNDRECQFCSIVNF